ncbi:MAG TPA: Gfo/Idh/MocA family oxidoreductase [Candidatus Ratteibacteria bacterium]|nr:Gfo/Idh/MocA family oxidoreductase [bacterium]HPC29696.1 Gfo/Idh/MocA family oxidoreductase [bacterium]HRS06508.1 Gfo/Idh/MocA family oxidoreductase [Candidatus Ratteibacteria bacterium]HRV04617.1 Gfo/Idh/MocA family oxidoreductase [Candidatus Ratteibacteria bacterium]
MKKINWALIGAGTIANKRVCPAIVSEQRSKLQLIVDKDISKAQALSVMYGCEKYSSRFEDAIQSNDIDAIYIATPVFLHSSQTIAAINAGKHVICEKPLGIDFQSADRVVKAAEASSVKSTTAYFRRFYPKYSYVKNMLENQKFGKVLLIRMCYHTWTQINPDSPIFWRTEKKLSGGGIIADMGSHMFDVLIGLFGVPSSVFAKMRNLVFDYDVEDSSAVMMEYKNGFLVTASFNWNSKTYAHEFEVLGTEAKTRWIPYDGDKITVITGSQTEEIDLPNHKNVHYPLIEDFVSSIIENRSPLISMEEAAKTNLLIDACYQSSAQCKEINL